MALIACAECGNEVSTTAKSCPKCGAKVKKPSTGEGKWIAGALVLIVVLVFAFGAQNANSPEAKEKWRQRGAIEMCWSEQKRKSLGAGEQQFIAGACEKMEADFVRRYGSRP